MPSMGRAIKVMARAFAGRCPHCGGGWVLAGFDTVRDRCSRCGLRFCRSDDDYFSGAMFFGLLIGESLAVLGLAAVMLLTWPNVPWDFLQYGGTAVLLLVLIAVFPLSKVVWLGVDVLVRPVTSEEMLDTNRPQPTLRAAPVG
jgi:uncharacterized protein (DUF983 family)